MQQPQVTVNLLAFRGTQVSGLGHVARPGRYPLETSQLRLSDMLATAGGISPEGADFVIVTGIRDGQPFRKEVDIAGMFLDGKRLQDDILVLGGDAIYVQRQPKFYIYGEVKSAAGFFRIERNMTIRQALALSGGPTIERREGGETRVTPAITASYAQKVFFGSVGLAYDRAVGTGGGLGGPTDNDIVTGYVTITNLLRGLTVQFLPRYSNIQSPHSDKIDIQSLTLALAATYRFTDWVAVIGGYQFFHQRSDSTAVSSIGLPLANDADQNRLFFGVTFGYPIRID